MENNIKKLLEHIAIIKEHENHVKHLKEAIESKLNGENFKNEAIEIYWRKPSVRKTMKKEQVDHFKIFNPEYFKDTEVKGGYSYKLTKVDDE